MCIAWHNDYAISHFQSPDVIIIFLKWFFSNFEHRAEWVVGTGNFETVSIKISVGWFVRYLTLSNPHTYHKYKKTLISSSRKAKNQYHTVYLQVLACSAPSNVRISQMHCKISRYHSFDHFDDIKLLSYLSMYFDETCLKKNQNFLLIVPFSFKTHKKCYNSLDNGHSLQIFLCWIILGWKHHISSGFTI